MFNHCIYFNLSTLTRQITKIWQNEFSTLGLSPSHGYLLAAMSKSPEAQQKHLSEIMELDASTITRFIDALAAKKLIEKTSIGKGATYKLTKRGHEVTEKIDSLMNSLFAEMQEVFGKQDFTNLVNNLQNTKLKLKEK